ncbi:MAG: LemA family protein [Bacteroidales bacterium]|jgi:LemA protein|nr:LemA family protein [Bacteroidales bacterium]MBR4468183.1 LemA family protein [Bacteroidales bacterium]MDO5314980.1 LemA family protein [bacterium]
MKKGILVILILALLAVLWGMKIYNGLVSQQEAVETAVGNVQTAYQKRADLIPNLVATVKNYAEYEAGTLTAVVEARAKATATTLDASNLTEENMKAFQAAQDEMSGALSRLLVTVEQYPDLKANQNYLDLQSQLEACENTIANARREFNETAKAYNTAVRRFPANIVANMFGFDKKPYFEASEAAQQAPDVKDLFE